MFLSLPPSLCLHESAQSKLSEFASAAIAFVQATPLGTMRRNSDLFVVTLLCCINSSLAIDCFKCTSFGGSQPWCEDPFHHNFSATILHSPCWSGRKGRDGLYPATFCVKLNGRFDDTGETMMIRDCSLDSGSLTTDTELVRMSHCGSFYFGNRYVRGCVQSCSEDACNHSDDHPVPLPLVLLLILGLLGYLIIYPSYN